ncbi:hypothetical protein BN159_6516 [Streptomyces davaonensis JCM 4913]|uniref:ABM domain-containing protein n=1 Tax=Streptomyces davaonensis (strain DSM 101723 / JCM 4913 / KCC S-0913 / 768) TaxID=1214101 RepID=K4RC55_STRDJ|nr:hypothetical protein [Streptomyces davaonensis]CCK30895.1 hypothetical protein BN159_6516 [Streptomyces davaonensis JCM 4913]
MKFVQIIDFETERLDEMEPLLEEARQRNAGREGGPTHRILLKDRDTPGRYLSLIEFDSYEEAMRNSEDPETTKMAEQLGALCTREPRFVNCDLLDSSDLK